MLLEFKIKNYKSFAEEAVFSMVAAPKQKGLDYSLMKTRVKGKEIKGLSSSVIYGPNASGKTNIIGAMDVLRSIVLRGNIRNSEEKSSPNPAAEALELIPNSDDTEGNLGVFLNEDYPRRIISENLFVNGEPVFQRSGRLYLGNMKVIKGYLSGVTVQNPDSISEIAENSLSQDELFLTNGFRLVVSPGFARLIADWFADKFMIICRADSMQLIKRFADPKKKAVYIEKTTDQAAKLFGINSNAVGYVVSEEEPDAKLYSIFRDAQNRKSRAVAAEIFESYGTIRFINMFPLVIKAIQTGGTLVVDEFDASIHPMALMSIINVFHNDEVNIHHAQLIFNTHNPIFLNSNLFRRDEIKFVERDDDSHQSILYALSDFGTTGDRGVRKHEDYMGKYFISQYGAIKNIDFTPVFEEILHREGEV